MGGLLSVEAGGRAGSAAATGEGQQHMSTPGEAARTIRSKAYLRLLLLAAAIGVPTSLKLQPSQQTVMSGLHYKFNWW